MDITITSEDIEEFKAIYRQEYGIDISDAEALEMGTRLLRVVKVVVDVGGQERTPGPSPTG